MDREASLQALNMQRHSVSIDLGAGAPITLETGYLAKQAAGSIVVGQGDSMVLSTVCDGDPRPGLDFFPLMVDYREKAYAAGRIPGNFFKREARPSDHETLTSRLTDRPLRPLFPAGYKRDTACSSFVISYDELYETDILSMIGVSAACTCPNCHGAARLAPCASAWPTANSSSTQAWKPAKTPPSIWSSPVPPMPSPWLSAARKKCPKTK